MIVPIFHRKQAPAKHQQSHGIGGEHKIVAKPFVDQDTDGGRNGIADVAASVVGAADQVVPVDLYVPGCPPRPSAMIVGMLAAADMLAEKLKHK